jgi:uncharacterized protein
MAIFWLSLAAMLIPGFGVGAGYSTTGNPLDGYATPGFNSAFGIYLVAWGLVLFILLLCSIKTNIVSVALFTILDAGFFIFAGSHFQTAYGNLSSANILQKVSAFLMWKQFLTIGWCWMYFHRCHFALLSLLHLGVR